MIWNIITAIATLVSMVAYIVTLLYIRAELMGLEKDRYINVTNELFALWQSREFMEAQLWLLHRLEEKTWAEFIAKHRGDMGEMAFHRVGSFYDRVGTLVRMQLISDKEILSTMGGYAIAVWQKIEPLVREAREIENSVLFDDFEALLPSCHACYVPSLAKGMEVKPFQLTQPVRLVSVEELKRKLDRNEPLILLDVRQKSDIERDPRRLPNAVLIPPDAIAQRFAELPSGQEVFAYCA